MEPFVSAHTPQISYLARGEVDAINAAFSLDDLWESSMATGEAANEARASASGLPSTLVPHSVTVQSSFIIPCLFCHCVLRRGHCKYVLTRFCG